MKISKKAEYAVRALAILASRSSARPVQIQDLAEEGQIPLKFLEQILLALRRAGVLRSKRGTGGGYQLERPASEVTLAEIIGIIDGTWSTVPARSSDPAPGCRALDETLRELDALVRHFLEQQTLATLIQREEPSGFFDI